MGKASHGKIERWYFEMFRKMYPLPPGCVRYGDKPDVILHGTRKIGIEITNLYLQPGDLPASEQRQRILRETVLAKAQCLYLTHRYDQIEVAVAFDRKNPIDSRRIEALARALAETVRLQEKHSTGPVRASLFREKAPEIKSIYLVPGKWADPKWRPVQVYSPGSISRSRLEATVKEKEAKVAGYKNCDSCWLLIVVDGIDAAQDQDAEADNVRVCSDVFERIILFHTFGSVVEAKRGATHHEPAGSGSAAVFFRAASAARAAESDGSGAVSPSPPSASRPVARGPASTWPRLRQPRLPH